MARGDGKILIDRSPFTGPVDFYTHESRADVPESRIHGILCISCHVYVYMGVSKNWGIPKS